MVLALYITEEWRLLKVIYCGYDGVVDEKRNKPVELVYKVPDEVEGLSHITMDIDAKDCQKIWNW